MHGRADAAHLNQASAIPLHLTIAFQPASQIAQDIGSALIAWFNDPIMHPLPVTSRLNNSGSAEVGQVSRDFGLRRLQHFNEVAHTDLIVAHEVQEPQPRPVSERSEQELHTGSLGCLAHLIGIVAWINIRIDECVFSDYIRLNEYMEVFMNPFDRALKAHVALNVGNVEASVKFYKQFFGIEPAKTRPGYAKFDVQSPPLNLSLNEGAPAEAGRLSHLGIQVPTTEDVLAIRQQWIEAGLSPRDEMQTNCCYALQDKSWVRDPDGNEWEVFVVLQDNLATSSACCSSEPALVTIGAQ
jgi:catechol 2,3-dioxygenase-like lactoylglutathione lyase family enzyme